MREGERVGSVSSAACQIERFTPGTTISINNGEMNELVITERSFL